MTAIRRDLPAGEITAVDVQLSNGDVTLRAAEEGAAGVLEADDAAEVETRGETLHVRHEQAWPVDLRITLPGSVRHVRCLTGHGALRLEGVHAEVHARTGKGDVSLAGGGGRADLETGKGDVRADDWQGPLQLRTGKGNVEAERVRGGLEVRTGKGDVKLDEATERVEVRAGHGSVVAGRLAGEASLQTGHGDVVATDLAGARLEARTGHGEIALGGRLAGLRASTGRGEVVCHCELVEGTFELSSGHGDVTLHLPANADLRIDAATSHGRVESNLPLVKVGRPGPEGAFGRRFVGSIGSAEPKATVLLRTAHGDIRITRPGDGGEATSETAEHLAGSATERAWHETLRAHASQMRAEPEDLEDLEDLQEQIEEQVEAAVAGIDAEVAERVRAQMEDLGERMRDLGEQIREQVTPHFGGEPAGPGQAPEQVAAEPSGQAGAPTGPEPPSGQRVGQADPRKNPAIDILEAVSRGELSVDEALALLGKLD